MNLHEEDGPIPVEHAIGCHHLSISRMARLVAPSRSPLPGSIDPVPVPQKRRNSLCFGWIRTPFTADAPISLAQRLAEGTEKRRVYLFRRRGCDNPRGIDGHSAAMPRHALNLEDQMASADLPKGRRGKGKRKRNEVEEKQERTTRSDEGRKILREARRQQEEVEAEARSDGADAIDVREIGKRFLEKKEQLGSHSDVSEDEVDDWEDLERVRLEKGEYVRGNDVDVSEADERAIEAFRKKDGEGQKTLADVILDRIREKQEVVDEEQERGPWTSAQTIAPRGMDEKVVQIYRGVGDLMKRYTTGKVPKAFKVIPSLHNWEEVLYLTEPEHWSPHATYQATRLFASNLSAKQAQRFYSLVLLPKVRKDIKENRKLHFALFQALLKATYKPAAFYKGILLPLCRSGTCTLREAVILSSALQKASIPVLHSAAAIMRVATMEYSGVNSFFLRVLLDKKYALPLKVVDSLVDHFMSFVREKRELPVVWHQALLCFVQRYKADIRPEDKESLLKLIEIQHHYLVSPEVARELQHVAQDSANKKKLAKLPKPMEEDMAELPPVPLGDI